MGGVFQCVPQSLPQVRRSDWRWLRDQCSHIYRCEEFRGPGALACRSLARPYSQ
jgi:hypothetical protein